MIKVFLLSVFAALGIYTLSVSSVYAQDFCATPSGAQTEYCKGQSTGTATNNSVVGPNGVMTKLVTVLSLIVGAAAVIAIIVGGIMFAVSNGDSSHINKARQTIIYGLVGLVVSIFARSIVAFVLNRL